MVVSKGDADEVMTPPVTLTPNRLAYWSTTHKQVVTLDGGKAMVTKAKKLVDMNLVKPVSDNKWDILPIKGYNSTTYRVTKAQFADSYECNCQGYSKYGDRCSHTVAVKFYEEIEEWNNG